VGTMQPGGCRSILSGRGSCSVGSVRWPQGCPVVACCQRNWLVSGSGQVAALDLYVAGWLAGAVIGRSGCRRIRSGQGGNLQVRQHGEQGDRGDGDPRGAGNDAQ
jgi:hypothetical protein